MGEYTIIYIKRRNGDRHEIFIDTEDLDLIKSIEHKWYVDFDKCTNGFYAKATIYLGSVNGKSKNKILLMHRHIVDAKKGDVVDHINHNRLDNRKSNLRIVSYSKNSKNRKDKNSNNTTGYRNVSYVKSEDKYIVQLQIDGKNKRLGTFDDVHEAGKFAEKMRKKYYKSA